MRACATMCGRPEMRFSLFGRTGSYLRNPHLLNPAGDTLPFPIEKRTLGPLKPATRHFQPHFPRSARPLVPRRRGCGRSASGRVVRTATNSVLHHGFKCSLLAYGLLRHRLAHNRLCSTLLLDRQHPIAWIVRHHRQMERKYNRRR
jgi:hypothetical protein